MSALVSIVVPVYNLEPFIRTNIENLTSQTYGDIEILYVDDGSRDRSAEIIRQAAAEDPRIRYIPKENGGVSSARNLGLQHAKGDFVMFVDGDDAMHPRAVELLMDAMRKTGSAIVFADFLETQMQLPPPEALDACEVRPYALREILQSSSSILCVSVWSKLFRRSVLKDAQFPTDIAIGEDAYFMFRLLRKAPLVTYLDAKLYYYYQRETSAMHTKIDPKRQFIVKASARICAEFTPEDDENVKAFYLNRLYQFLCYERTMLYGLPACREQLADYQRIGETYRRQLLDCTLLGAKRYLYWFFFRCRPAYELFRLVQDPTMRAFYKQRKLQAKQATEPKL